MEVAMALEAYAARDWRACGENLGEVLSKLFVSVQVMDLGAWCLSLIRV